MATLGRQPDSGLIVAPETFTTTHRELIIALAAAFGGGSKPKTPAEATAAASGAYANAGQIVEVLKTHRVPCDNVRTTAAVMTPDIHELARFVERLTQ